jgi:hypothetical protein
MCNDIGNEHCVMVAADGSIHKINQHPKSSNKHSLNLPAPPATL